MTDSLGVVEALRTAPEDLAAAHATTARVLASAALPDPDRYDHVCVLGMGGSGVVGDVLAAVASGSCPVPVLVSKQQTAPTFLGPRTLAVAVSYSGSTGETLAQADAAVAAGAGLVTVAAGGPLADLGAQRGLHLPVAPGAPGPRFALGPMVVPAVALLHRMGWLPDGHTGLQAAEAQLRVRRDACAPEIAAPRNPARELARRIGVTWPLVYGAGPVGAVAALRWKQSVNENAKAPAFWNSYPELDHNEVCAWGQHGDVTRQVLSLVELVHDGSGPWLDARIAATRDLVEECVAQILTVTAAGDGPLAQLLDLAYLGDWVSTYLALDHDVDPGPIDAIARLKRAVGG